MEDQGNDIRQIFLKEFETDCAFVSKAPGRINLIGEHTDYNMGLVMPAAIDKSVNMAFSPSDDLNCHFLAIDLGESYTATLDKIQKSERSWVNYLLGILIAFKKRKDTKHGFYCVVNSNIPIGAGMSSSAALECAFINGLNHMYEAQFDRWELIEMIQESAHHFLGIKSGILDQFASLFGRQDSAVILDCGTHNYEYVKVPLQNHSFILVDTKVKHTHLTSAYNDRVEECNSALKKIQLEYAHIQSLSDSELKIDMIGDLPLSDTELKRTKFIISENQRVISFKEALESGNIDRLGALLYDSHEGLRRDYEVSCPELDFLVEQTNDMSYVNGARMMGGGFGGCTLNLVFNDYVQKFKREISGKYFNNYGINPDVYNVILSDGAGIIQNDS